MQIADAFNDVIEMNERMSESDGPPAGWSVSAGEIRSQCGDGRGERCVDGMVDPRLMP